jgi:hypothetical protein
MAEKTQTCDKSLEKFQSFQSVPLTEAEKCSFESGWDERDGEVAALEERIRVLEAQVEAALSEPPNPAQWVPRSELQQMQARIERVKVRFEQIIRDRGERDKVYAIATTAIGELGGAALDGETKERE